jgi:cytochrome subunit of sulfide dehydrogenase
MNATRIAVAVAVVVASIAPAFAASPEPPAGASSCSGCHAANAGADTPVPRLQGRNAAEIVTQMQAFRTGQQASTVMDRIAKGYSDPEIAAIAAWYAQQR